MLRFIINYFRSCFCQHNFEAIKEVHIYEDGETKPSEIRRTYMCNKCGYIKRITF